MPRRVPAPLLWALATWALALSLLALVRQPGRADLPPQLLLGGRLYRPVPAPPPPGPLPEGLVLRAAADYVSITGTNGSGHAPTGQPHLRLRRVALTQTGRSAVIPVERLGTLLVAEGVAGQCVQLDAGGRVLRGWPTAATWRVARDARSARWSHRLAWLAGLRPYGDNSCLWMSAPGVPPQGSQ
ncbi:hypothetical protein KBY96_13530 [Cyanobium sp. ATX 6A2]|nr:hypothetical protein [Cyanobium sp. ATX 6A2]